MIRVLSMIAVAGFILSAVCLSIAVTIAGPDAVARGAWSWDGGNWDGHGWGWTVRSGGPETTRELAWTGGEGLDVDLPADVRFTQADGPGKLVIRGPKEAVDHLVIENGHLRYDRPHVSGGDDVTVELTAPKVTRFALNGSGRLELSNYRQDALAIELNGDGDVSAQGSAKSVQLKISGSGDADLGSFATDGADVQLSGSGEAKVAPKAWAKLDISGSGDVTLLSRPPRIESHVSGSGQINQEGGEKETAAPEKPAKSGDSV